MPALKQNKKLPERSIRRARVKSAKELEGGNDYEVVFDVPGFGEIAKRYPVTVDPDTEEGHEIQGLFGGEMPATFEYSDLHGKEAFVLLDSKRASGGRMEAFIGAVMTGKMIEEAARNLTPASTPTHATSHE